jgi:hypothetical protein
MLAIVISMHKPEMLITFSHLCRLYFLYLGAFTLACKPALVEIFHYRPVASCAASMNDRHSERSPRRATMPSADAAVATTC